MALAALRALDVGSWFSPAFIGEQVPTLAEAMDAALSLGLEPLVEHKAGSAADYDAAFLMQGFAPEEFRIISFDWTFLGDLDALEARYRLGALGRLPLDPVVIDAAKAEGADFLDWSHATIDQAAVDLVHARGMELFVYTVDDPDRMRELIDLGVDGITTNDPALLRSVLVPEPCGELLLLTGSIVLSCGRGRLRSGRAAPPG
jgi:glycerophosphoryl diester phosphodiesterase